MDWATWIIFGIVLIALVARVLIGPSKPGSDDEDVDGDDDRII